MSKSENVTISLDEYHRLQQVEKHCNELQYVFDNVNKNYNQLLEAQRTAAEKYRSTHDPSVKREAWLELLLATMKFMTTMPNANIGAHHMITELLGCLGDVDEGRTSPLLKPANKKPKRTDTNLNVAEQGVAAALVDILHNNRQGLPLPDAAKRAVRISEKCGLSLPKQIGPEKGNNRSWKSLINWRKRMNAAKADDPTYDVAKASYHHIMKVHRSNQEEHGYSSADAAKILTEYILPRLVSKKVHSTL